jgi:hypothetical protein
VERNIIYGEVEGGGVDYDETNVKTVKSKIETPTKIYNGERYSYDHK